ncbi:hypothetical protein KZ829_38340 [Actinoplanes hulinensis]|uniref:Uncharacterized protein n=1 Tax=Actinoplanes hulinensis TaxID=1144547 RepID=A0ABS7BFD1_9ACTN|nr:hypothetical protein [Actinoplanes hulinensis]MBW6439603.1 hypothetical protein [Actinoplanes hulinensis]
MKAMQAYRFALDPDRMHVTLPRLGRLKVHESARQPARGPEAGTARIMSATVRRECGRWFVSFTVEVERSVPAAAEHPESVSGPGREAVKRRPGSARAGQSGTAQPQGRAAA